MPDLETVTRIARDKLGAMSRLATGELRMLVRLLGSDEPILAMAVGRVRGTWRPGATRVVVATPQRILLVVKATFTRRERVREIALASVRGARAVPLGTLELELDDGVLRICAVSPAAQLSALAEAARGTSGGGRFAELDEIARRKLGRVLGASVEGSLIALAEELQSDEAVVDLAFWAGKPGGIVAACPQRLVVIPDKGFGVGAPASVPFSEVVDVHAEGAALVVRTNGGEQRFEPLAPPDRANVIAARVGAQLR